MESIAEISPEHFDWQKWRAGSPSDLFLICRETELIRARMQVKKYAIGYCKSEHCLCRPKIGHRAVMFLKGEIMFWFHLRDREFRRIFNES